MSEKQEFSEIVLEGGTYETLLTKKFMQRKPYAANNPKVIKALIPGVVGEISTAVGKQVKKGDTLMILEAMKMFNRIKAPMDGIIKALPLTAGEKVTKGQTLIEIE